MLDQSAKIEAAKQTARMIFYLGVEAERPLRHSRKVTEMMLEENGLPVPDDVLAFASEGRLSDRNVRDWEKPHDLVLRRVVTTENIFELI
ncbi:hypothetical protein [Salipiger abyssi]|nr:hypothetical protein [Salipiger abyssi]MBR9893820.1 hypothetical protein [bacterium]